MHEGSGLPRDEPILELRNRLIAEAIKLDPYQKIELIIRYWMAWKDGKRPQRKIAIRNEWPINFVRYGHEEPKERDNSDE